MADAPAASGPEGYVSPSAACVTLAISSGVFATLSAVAITYPAHRAARSHEPQSRVTQVLSVLANLALSGTSILLGILANGQGPVAVAFPLGVGSNLLSNMIIQSKLGIAEYTKNMRVGIMVLAAAVMILPDSGPADLPPDVDVLTLLQTKQSVTFIVVCGVAMICGLCALVKGGLTDNMSLLLLYAIVGGTGTVLSTSISKLIQMNLPHWVLVPFLIVYVLLGCLCLGVAASANSTLEDPSLFVPVGAGVNLVLMFLAGLCIWGDWERLHYPLNYFMVYVLIVLGTYLVSSFDLLSSSTTTIAEQQVQFVKVAWQTHGPRGHAHFRDRSYSMPLNLDHTAVRDRLGSREDLMYDSVRSLREIWEQRSPDSNLARLALKKCLVRGLDRCVIGNEDIVDLCLALMQEPGEPGNFRSPVLVSWLRQHVRSFAQHKDSHPAGSLLAV